MLFPRLYPPSTQPTEGIPSLNTSSHHEHRATSSLLAEDAAKIVSEVSTSDRTQAFTDIWQALQERDGAVWHRPVHSDIGRLSAKLETLAPKLSIGESFARIKGPNNALPQALEVIRSSSLHGRINLDEEAILASEMVDMYRMISTMTACSDIVLDLRVERQRGFIENYHVDYGTAALIAFVGPGTHFVSRDNLPVDPDSNFRRGDLANPEKVFEVPTNSMLFMRGKSDDLPEEIQGLWHSSPPKTWHGQEQWSERALLIAATPKARIIPTDAKIASSLFKLSA